MSETQTSNSIWNSNSSNTVNWRMLAIALFLDRHEDRYTIDDIKQAIPQATLMELYPTIAQLEEHNIVTTTKNGYSVNNLQL